MGVTARLAIVALLAACIVALAAALLRPAPVQPPANQLNVIIHTPAP